MSKSKPTGVPIQFTKQEENLINLSFLMGDVTYSVFHATSVMLVQKGSDLKFSVKQRFNILHNKVKEAEQAALKYTGDINKLTQEEQECFIDDADMIYGFLMLIVDRFRGDKVLAKKAYKYLYDTYSSKGYLPVDSELNLTSD